MNNTANEKSFSRWYGKNGTKLNEDRKKRYESDPEYRQKCIDSARQSRENRRKRQRESGVVNSEVIVKTLNGAQVNCYRITDAAKLIGISPQTLRKMESDGFIPPCSFAGVHRYYTESQVALMRDCLDEVKKHPLHTKERYEALDIMKSTLRNGW